MKCAEMTESANDRICERLLISVLPLFEYIVPRLTSATAFGAPLSEIDDRTRRLQTFAAKLLPEVKAIRHLLQDVVEQYASAPKTDSDDYVELLSKVLILFESLVSDDVPGQTVESDLVKKIHIDRLTTRSVIARKLTFTQKLGDQKYLKLDALQRCLQAAGRDNNAFASMEHLILLATREKKHEKILSRIIKYNRRLARLVDQDYSTFVLPETEPPKSSPPYEIRDTVNKLYEILLASWQKTCEVPHLAKLRLATFRRLQCPTTDSDVGQDFDLLFSTHAPRRWQQSTVRVCEDGTNKSRSLTFEKKRRGPLRIREPARIESICSVIDHSVTMSSCLLLHFEDEKLLKLAPRSEPKYLPMAAHGPTVSLKTLIESATTFSLKQRRVLAVILSYSLLYVGESQWLRREWTKEDVCFIQTDNNMVDIGRPYLSAEFPGPGINPGIDDETQDCPHPAPSILGLGILLIELEFGKMIESLWKKEDLRNGKKNLNSNITAAMRFLENQRPWDDVYTNFRRAVSACIKGNFLESAEIVDDESFQQAVYTNIVVHLEEELFRGFGIKADALSNTPHHINLHCNTSVDSVKSLETFETETTLFKGEISLCTRPTFKFLHDFGSDFEQESDFRVFDSVLMSGPESNAK
ncbi:hypothetical protein N431DRAFT_75410 [Stipitochalara longipes BDJ]|nr:hypothetical protein N431DRAFT_75410 [Stipitochalara longipes BDJ]